ncbi:MAG: enoyl-CoA hydratase [Frondihabitans sp.]|nr:enoyl-CoA hydratase [Frondihabitans sp.]
MSELIVDGADNGVVVVTLNRPRARNALSLSLREELLGELVRLQGDDSVGAIVLTGSDPAFCAGMDTKELERDPASIHTIGPRYRPLFESRKPVIGAINGAAMAGGLELALACDWLIASDAAVFADGHTRLGLTPGWGLTVLLAEAVGTRRARQLITTGLPMDAETALHWGLVSEVVPHADLLPRAREFGRAIVSNDPDAVARVLETFSQQRSIADSAAWAVEARHWREASGVRSTQSNQAES